jgi:phenylacetate-CoA ligase
MADTVRYGESWCYGFWGLGIRPSDTFYFAFGWGNFAGFWSAYWGARRLGCRVVSGGGLDTKGHVQAILRTRPTVLISTPTFALRIAAVAAEMGVDLSQSSVKFTYHAGEPGPTALPGMREQIERAWGAKAGELLGIAEVDAMAPGLPERRRRAHERDEPALVVDGSRDGQGSRAGEIGENVVTGYGQTGAAADQLPHPRPGAPGRELQLRPHLGQARRLGARPHRLHGHGARHQRLPERGREHPRRGARASACTTSWC